MNTKILLSILLVFLISNIICSSALSVHNSNINFKNKYDNLNNEYVNISVGNIKEEQILFLMKNNFEIEYLDHHQRKLIAFPCTYPFEIVLFSDYPININLYIEGYLIDSDINIGSYYYYNRYVFNNMCALEVMDSQYYNNRIYNNIYYKVYQKYYFSDTLAELFTIIYLFFLIISFLVIITLSLFLCKPSLNFIKPKKKKLF